MQEVGLLGSRLTEARQVDCLECHVNPTSTLVSEIRYSSAGGTHLAFFLRPVRCLFQRSVVATDCVPKRPDAAAS